MSCAISFKKTDADKIFKAREILLGCMEQPYPLAELALKVGINECTLRKGFKEVFDCTVFGYLQDIKMQNVKKALFEGPKSISEIADELGYKNATHFTSAFKKKFGIISSKIKTKVIQKSVFKRNEYYPVQCITPTLLVDFSNNLANFKRSGVIH